jgi:hypothetical protein
MLFQSINYAFIRYGYLLCRLAMAHVAERLKIADFASNPDGFAARQPVRNASFQSVPNGIFKLYRLMSA